MDTVYVAHSQLAEPDGPAVVIEKVFLGVSKTFIGATRILNEWTERTRGASIMTELKPVSYGVPDRQAMVMRPTEIGPVQWSRDIRWEWTEHRAALLVPRATVTWQSIAIERVHP